MKHLQLLSQLLLCVFVFSAPAYSQFQTSEALNGSQLLARVLVDAYESYKNGDREKSIDNLQSNLAFEISKDVVHSIPKQATVDSLIFRNDQAKRWGYLKTVDLEYMKCIEGVVSFESDMPHEVAESLINEFTANGLNLEKYEPNHIKFGSIHPIHVVDDRNSWKTVSKYDFQYAIDIHVIENYVMVEFNEIVPRNWMPLTRNNQLLTKN